jgi:hypothetical protein
MFSIKGLKSGEIGRKVGLSSQYVRDIMCSPQFAIRRERMERSLGEQVNDVLKNHAIKAVKKITQIAHDGTTAQKLQLEAAKEILYLLGIKPVDVFEQKGRDLTDEETKSAKNTIGELEKIMNRLDEKKSSFVIARRDEVELTAPSEVSVDITTQPTPDAEHLTDSTDRPEVVSA